MAAENDATNKACVVDAAVFVLFPFSLWGSLSGHWFFWDWTLELEAIQTCNNILALVSQEDLLFICIFSPEARFYVIFMGSVA